MKHVIFHTPDKLTIRSEFVQLLIMQELKNRKLFRILQKAGLTDCFYQPHLDELIFLSLELNDDSEEIFNRYCSIMDKRSRKLKQDCDSIRNQASKVYQELLQEKKKIEFH